MKVCNERWYASRIKVESVPVWHVCAEELDHLGPHICSCGAKSDEINRLRD